MILDRFVLNVNRTICSGYNRLIGDVQIMNMERIKNLREDSDMNQTELAMILNISQRAYSHYERGDREIPLKTLVSIADYYNVSVDYLLERTNKKEVNR